MSWSCNLVSLECPPFTTNPAAKLTPMHPKQLPSWAGPLAQLPLSSLGAGFCASNPPALQPQGGGRHRLSFSGACSSQISLAPNSQNLSLLPKHLHHLFPALSGNRECCLQVLAFPVIGSVDLSLWSMKQWDLYSGKRLVKYLADVIISQL